VRLAVVVVDADRRSWTSRGLMLAVSGLRRARGVWLLPRTSTYVDGFRDAFEVNTNFRTMDQNVQTVVPVDDPSQT
jgi:hypothetical protein